MSARFLIVDCHSVIFAWPELRKLHGRRTASAREALARDLRDYQDQSGVRVVAVFDGKGDKVSEEHEPGGIQIFYSRAGQTADTIIERLVARHGAQEDITVATSDLLEQQTAASFGAQCISAENLKEIIEDTRRNFGHRLRKFRRK